MLLCNITAKDKVYVEISKITLSLLRQKVPCTHCWISRQWNPGGSLGKGRKPTEMFTAGVPLNSSNWEGWKKRTTPGFSKIVQTESSEKDLRGCSYQQRTSESLYGQKMPCIPALDEKREDRRDVHSSLDITNNGKNAESIFQIYMNLTTLIHKE